MSPSTRRTSLLLAALVGATGCARSSLMPVVQPSTSGAARAGAEGFPSELRSELSDVTATVDGPLPRAAVLSTMEANWKDLAICASPYGIRDDIGSSVLITATVSATGELQRDELGIPRTDGHADRLDFACVLGFLSEWRFPAAPGPSKIQLSFHLKPSERFRRAVYDRVRMELALVCREMPPDLDTPQAMAVALSRLKGEELITPLRLARSGVESAASEDQESRAASIRRALSDAYDLAKSINDEDWCLPFNAAPGSRPRTTEPPAAVAAFASKVLTREQLEACALVTRVDEVTGRVRTDWEAPWEDDRVALYLEVHASGVELGDRPWARFINLTCLQEMLGAVKVPPGLVSRWERAPQFLRFRTTLAWRNERQLGWRPIFETMCRDFERGQKPRRVMQAALDRPALRSEPWLRRVLTMFAALDDEADAAVLLENAASERGIEDFCPRLTAWVESERSKRR